MAARLLFSPRASSRTVERMRSCSRAARRIKRSSSGRWVVASWMQRPWTWTAAMCTSDEPHRGPCGRVTNTIGAATWLRDEVSPSGRPHWYSLVFARGIPRRHAHERRLRASLRNIRRRVITRTRCGRIRHTRRVARSSRRLVRMHKQRIYMYVHARVVCRYKRKLEMVHKVRDCTHTAHTAAPSFELLLLVFTPQRHPPLRLHIAAPSSSSSSSSP